MKRNEAQTRRDLIDPKLHRRGWPNELVKVEVTPGKTEIINGRPKRKKGRTDYLLCIPSKTNELSSFPVAVVEAKKEEEPAFVGLEQAVKYKERFCVPFAFSTNGHLYCDASSDLKNIKESLFLNDFPTPTDLRKRYEKLYNLNLDSKNLKPLFVPYKGGENQRYYFQDAAIRSCINNIAKGNKRILLSLATGTGKTVLVKHLLWKLSEGQQLKRALFLVDRDELRTQALTHLQDVFKDDAQEIKTNSSTNAKILIATYQTLNITNEDDKPLFWKKNFPKNFFSHIIIDECHRSAWGKWSIILKDNPEAVHIGLTATPRNLFEKNKNKLPKEDTEITSNNLKYFGKPIFEYKISSAQEDGYLAACEVNPRPIPSDKKNITKQDILNLKTQVINTGKQPEESSIREEYSSKYYERELILDDRIKAMTETFFSDLLDTGNPYQKSIIFCASDNHASLVKINLQKIYNDWCEKNNKHKVDDYAFKCTYKETAGSTKDLIADFKASKNSHYIATTVDLLSTGVDIPNLNNVIFFSYIESPIVFYQMVGRGTRTGNPRGSKLMFRIYDYTNSTRLFGKDFISSPPSESENGNGGGGGKKFETIRVKENQFKIEINNEAKSILSNIDGKDVLIDYDEYKNNISKILIEKIINIQKLRNIWVNTDQRKKLLSSLPEGPSSIHLIRKLEKLDDCDLFDVLSNLAFMVRPISMNERSDIFLFKNKLWIENFPNNARSIITSISKQFSKGGIEELETPNLFDEKEIVESGGIAFLEKNKIDPFILLSETKIKLLS